ncbi:hypothetical protein EUX98_g7291 [Antrodiella citrinella]|uniref:Uncharacterized protein n=1 Tax=Antrodiella citrinella TaxID=2447956 RepID=A0A4S4MLV2_9APHY|nr:hypothetical protein EUX98_g7291 [Antrodiella citrinella]
MSINRVALVTGAAQGMGEAIALRLAEDPSGIDVAILDIPGKETQLANVAKAIEAKGRKAIWIAADVSSEDSVKGAVEKTVAEFGGLDIMVANAGVTLFKPMIETTVEDWNKIHSINALGVMLCFKHAAIQMIKQGRGGRIIGACSGSGKQGVNNMSAYSASKFATQLVLFSALELKSHKITVNSYAPGFILTPMLAHPDDDKYGGLGSVAKMAANMPPEMEGAKPDVIAELVAYLIKPQAWFMTGQTLIIDGGLFFD